MIILRWCRSCDHPELAEDEGQCSSCSSWVGPNATARMRRREAAYAERMAARHQPANRTQPGGPS